MAVTLESSTQDVQEMQDALVAAGLTVREPEKPAEPVKPAAEEKNPSETKEAPGEQIPAETKVEAPAATEVAEPKTTQEPTQEEGTPEEKPSKSKGGFQAKVEKLTRRVDMLQEELEAKTGNEAALRQKLEEAQAELAALKPQPKEESGPVRPKRPTRKDFDFDEDKYEEALAKYDQELDEYHQALRDKDRAEALAEFEKTAQARAEEAAFLARRNADAKTIEDFDEVIAMLPPETETSKIEIPPAVMTYIMQKSQHPAKLMYFLAKDYLENDSEARDRLAGMDPIDQLLEIREIERDLVAKAKAEPKPAKTAPAKAAEPNPPKPEAAPAKPKPKAETPEAPIDPVGSRTTAAPESMEQLAARAAAGDAGAQKALALKTRELLGAKHRR